MSGAPIDLEQLAAWVEASCAAQGVPFKVTDALAIAKVARLVGTANP